MNKVTTCPGCGLQTLPDNNKIIKEMNASSACLDLYYQLSYYTLSLHDTEFIHQHIVDTYAIQHANQATKPITVAFALIGIYLTIVHGYTGKQVQDTHKELANKTKNWPTFSIPSQKAILTVQDVIQSEDENKKEMIIKWTNSLWDIWTVEEEHVSALISQFIII